MPREAKAWPKWTEPATKGDIIKALVATRTDLANMIAAFSSLHGGDNTKLRELLSTMVEGGDDIRLAIDDIGGLDG